MRPGFILSPYLFNIYTDKIVRETDIDDIGVKIVRRLYAIRMAALVADILTSMSHRCKVDVAGKTAEFNLNAKKPNVIHIGESGNQETKPKKNQ